MITLKRLKNPTRAFVCCLVSVLFTFHLSGKNIPNPGQREDIKNTIKLIIKKGSYTDETAIRFTEGATDDFDGDFDAWKMFSYNTSVPSIFTRLADSSALSINSKSSIIKDEIINVYTKINTAATCTLTTEELYPFEEGIRIFIQDLKTNAIYDLDTDSVIVINYAAADNGINPRLKIIFSYPAQIAITDNKCGNDGIVLISKLGFTGYNYRLIDSANVVLLDKNTSEIDSIKGLPGGEYRLLSLNYNNSYDTLNFSLSHADSTVAGLTAIIQGYRYSPTVNFKNQSINATSYLWDFGDGSVSTDFEPTHTYSKSGIYSVKLTASNGNCFSIASKDVRIRILRNLMPVKLDEHLIINPFANGNKEEFKSITIFDFQGKLLRRFEGVRDILYLDGNTLRSGINILVFESEDETWTEKVIW